jgi:hypothetical protein
MRDVAQVPHLDQSKVLLKLCESKLVRRYVGSGIMVSKKCRYRSGFVGARRGAGAVTLSLAAENVKTEWQKRENIGFVVKCDADCVLVVLWQCHDQCRSGL